MACKWCTWLPEGSKNTPFANGEGSGNYRQKTLDEHEISDLHIRSKAAYLKTTLNPTNYKDFFTNCVEITKPKLRKIIQTTYFCALNMVSLKFNENLNKFMIRLGVDLGEHYLDDSACRDLCISLGNTVQRNLKHSIDSTNSFVSILLDESMDGSRISKLLIYARYVSGFKPQEKYLTCLSLQNTTADEIFHVAFKYLYEEGFLDKLICVLGDNCRTMQGSITGVITQFQEKIPHIAQGRCFNHLNNLIIDDLMKQNPTVNKIKILVYKMTDFFKSSSLRSQYLRSSLE